MESRQSNSPFTESKHLGPEASADELARAVDRSTDQSLRASQRMGGSASGTEDALADGVLIADRLDGRPLDGDHGVPARLVGPNQYGFVSTKMQPSVSEPFWRGGCRPSAGGVRCPWRVKSSRT